MENKKKQQLNGWNPPPSRASRRQSWGSTVWRYGEYRKFAASLLKNPGGMRPGGDHSGVPKEDTSLENTTFSALVPSRSPSIAAPATPPEARNALICSPARLQLCPYSSSATFSPSARQRDSAN